MSKILRNKGLSLDDILLVPQFNPFESRLDVDTTSHLVRGFDVKVPIMTTNMATVTEQAMVEATNKVGAVGAIHRFLDVKDQARIVHNLKQQGINPVIASIGVGKGEYQRINKLVHVGVDVLLLDIAHAHTHQVEDIIKHVKTNYPTPLIVGNIATYDAAKYETVPSRVVYLNP